MSKKTGIAITFSGIDNLLFGNKINALAMFGKGLHRIEKIWRIEHPEFDGDITHRWQ